MPFNGSGVFTRVYNWVNDKNSGINITASRMDGEFDGMATGLSNCITKDGQTTVSANLPMAGFRHTAVSDATATNQYLTYSQAQSSTATWLGTAAGTADAATASPGIAATSYVTGAEFAYIPVGSNTITTPTINISGLGAKTITYRGAALQIGDIPSAGVVQIRYNGTTFDMLNAPLSRVLKAKGTAIASAATTDIGAADSDFIDITGTTGITSFGSTTTRNHVWINFTGVLTVTHNATSLILPGAANYTTAAGDVFECVRISGSNWQVVGINRTNGSPLTGAVFYTNLATADIAAGSDVSSGTASKIASAASVKSGVDTLRGQILRVKDERASGTAGGTFTSGAWQTRTLNTVATNNISGASLASNQITLPAGTYKVTYLAVAYQVGQNQTRLQNITDSSTIDYGCTNHYSNTVGFGVAPVNTCIFTLAASKVIELQHRCASTTGTTGFGSPSSFGNNEVYADVLVEKIG